MSDFEDTVTAYGAEAVETFNRAYAEVQAGLPTPLPQVPPPLPPEEQKKLAAAQQKLDKAQAQMAMAIKQLVYASQTLSDEDRRVGFKAVVRLMSTTADTAEAVCTRLRTEIAALGDPVAASQTQRINLLINSLQALANLAPISVWQQPPQTTS